MTVTRLRSQNVDFVYEEIIEKGVEKTQNAAGNDYAIGCVGCKCHFFLNRSLNLLKSYGTL
jgi:hypothetical protein